MSTGYSIKQQIILFLASIFGPIIILLYSMTWRVRWEGLENLGAARQAHKQVLFCVWHSRLLGLCYPHRFRKIGIMVSKSFDGELISRIVTKLGYRVFRGSASSNGAAALMQMLKSKVGDLALTVDGPRGPAEKVKPGAIALASNTGLPIVPLSIIAPDAWRFRSWDRFICPKPFSVITVKYGKGIEIPSDLNSEQVALAAQNLENEINRLG